VATVRPDSSGADGGPSTSVATRNSASRLLAEFGSAFFALLASTIVARHMGPSLKGTVSTLSYIVAIAAPACAVGMGESAVTLLARGHSDLRRALRATVALLALTTSLGAAAVFGVSVLIIGPGWQEFLHPLVITALTVPLATGVGVFGLLADSQQRIVFTSSARLTNAFVSAAMTFALVDLLDLWTTGAMLAMAAGWGVALVMLAGALVRSGGSHLPMWDRAYLGSAARLGVPIQISYLLIVASSRLDLLLVNLIAGPRAAGLYSISLTAAALSTYAAVALVGANYPRLAALSTDEDWVLFTQKLARLSIAAAVAGCAGLALFIPLLTAPIFGRAFSGSVPASLILVPGGIAWSAQWVICRAWAARGKTGLLVKSFAPAVATMLVLDFAFIPTLGIVGAAIAFDLSLLVGLGVSTAVYTSTARRPRALLALVPRLSDFVQLVVAPWQMVRHFRAQSRAH
jgi:O-antigen/teichoic acid export membrane protein